MVSGTQALSIFLLRRMWLPLSKLSHGPKWLQGPFSLLSNQKKRRKKRKEEGHTPPFGDTCLGVTTSLLRLSRSPDLVFACRLTAKEAGKCSLHCRQPPIWPDVGFLISREEEKTSYRVTTSKVCRRCYLWS